LIVGQQDDDGDKTSKKDIKGKKTEGVKKKQNANCACCA
jgi:hypothetical protein